MKPGDPLLLPFPALHGGPEFSVSSSYPCCLPPHLPSCKYLIAIVAATCLYSAKSCSFSLPARYFPAPPNKNTPTCTYRWGRKFSRYHPDLSLVSAAFYSPTPNARLRCPLLSSQTQLPDEMTPFPAEAHTSRFFSAPFPVINFRSPPLLFTRAGFRSLKAR